MTQNNLGVALRYQAEFAENAIKIELLNQAADAFQNALTVRTKTYSERQWVQTQNNLAEVYYLLEDWPHAAECYTNVLSVYPGTAEANRRASYICHEHLFQYEKAFLLDQIWVTLLENYDISSLSDFVEKHITTARYGQADTLINDLLPQIRADSRFQVYLRVFKMMAIIGAGRAYRPIISQMDTVIAVIEQQPEDYTVGWTFNGTRHFLQTSPDFEQQDLAGLTRREWLLSLIAALEAENREAILSALRAVKALLK